MFFDKESSLVIDYLEPHKVTIPDGLLFDLRSVTNTIPFELPKIILVLCKMTIEYSCEVNKIIFLIEPDKQYEISVFKNRFDFQYDGQLTSYYPFGGWCTKLQHIGKFILKREEKIFNKFDATQRPNKHNILLLSEKVKYLFEDEFIVSDNFSEALPELSFKSGHKYKCLITLQADNNKQKIQTFMNNEHELSKRLKRELRSTMMFNDFVLIINNIEFEYAMYKYMKITLHIDVETLTNEDYYRTIGQLESELEFYHKLQQYETIADKLNIDILYINDPYNYIKDEIYALCFNDFKNNEGSAYQ